jgi:hypothetical protein
MRSRRATAGESVVRSGPERRLKCFCAAFLRDPFPITRVNSSQPLPDCNMNNLALFRLLLAISLCGI